MGELFGALARLLPPLLLIVAVLVALRRWGRYTAPADGALRVVARAGLTRSAMVAIIAVGSRRFLVGAGDGGVRMLRELEPVEVEATSPNVSEPVLAARGGSVIDWLRARTLRTAGDDSRHAVGD